MRERSNIGQMSSANIVYLHTAEIGFYKTTFNLKPVQDSTTDSHTHNLNSDDEHVGSVGLHISLATHPSIQISSVPPPVFTIRFEMILSIIIHSDIFLLKKEF